MKKIKEIFSKKQIKFLVKLLISVIFVLWVVFRVDWREALFYLQKISYEKIFLYFVVYLAGIAISSKKWMILAQYKSINLPYWDFFKYYLSGTFVNNFMPSFIGGDFFRSYQIGKAENKYVEAASSVIFDRISGLFGAMILTVFFFLLNLETIISNDILLGINIALLVIIFLVIAVFIFRHLVSGKIFSELIPRKIIDVIINIEDYNKNKKVVFRAMIFAIFFSLIGLGLSNFILFWSLGVKISFLNFFSVIFLISIVSSIPISINNIGIKEWAYISFFGFFGVNSSAVVAVAVLSRFLQMLVSFLALPVYLKSKKINQDL